MNCLECRDRVASSPSSLFLCGRGLHPHGNVCTPGYTSYLGLPGRSLCLSAVMGKARVPLTFVEKERGLVHYQYFHAPVRLPGNLHQPDRDGVIVKILSEVSC